MTSNPCPRCDKPIADTAYICHDCTATLRRHLERLALRWPTLRVTIDRRDRIGDPGRNNGEQPLPFAWAAADNAWAISNTITTWARDIEEARGMTIPTTHGGRPLPVEIVCALWLSTQLDWLRHRDYAEQAFDELEDAAFSLYRVIDRPAQRMFLGACPTCKGRLYAPPGHDYITCRDCDTQIDVTLQRDTLLAAADDQLADASTIAAALTTWGEPLQAKRIYNWAHRGRVFPRSYDGRGRPLYRVGDVRDLVAEAEQAMLTRAKNSANRHSNRHSNRSA